MHILVGLVDPKQAGGIYVTESEFLEKCKKRPGMDLETFVFGSRSALDTAAGRALRLLRDVLSFAILVRGKKPDIIHLNSSFDKRALIRDLFYASVTKVLRRNLFIKFHGSEVSLLETTQPIFRYLSHKLFKWVSAFGVLSNEERANFLSAGVPAAKVFVVKNAVNPLWYCRDPAFRPRHNIDLHSPVILFTGRLIPTKGLIDVIRALALVRDQGQDFVFLCLGDGPTRTQADLEVERLRLRERVRFLGHVPEEQTREFYANATMLVFPTYHQEGFPMTIFQSVAAGIPVITTRIRAAADYLKEPDNCLWVEPRNPEMLADRILRLCRDDKARVMMGQNNRTIAAQFSAQCVTDELVLIFNRVCSVNL